MLILPLPAIAEEHAALVGPKAFSVARLASAGFDTPPGWCLTVEAYRAIVAAHPNVAAAVARLDAVDQEDLQEVARPADEIRQAILDLELPRCVVSEISDALGTLRNGPLAVRSSATSEDLGHAAAAGQHDTRLGVVGVDAVLRAIKECWASLWSARAIVYRSRFGGAATVEMAVLVQEFVEGRVSGVLFTRNPLNSRETELLVNAAVGSGESVVGGSTEVDTFIVDRRTMTSVETSTGSTPSVAADQLRTVCEAGLRAESLFGRALDVEWALADGRLFLLQARPITTGRGAPARKRRYLERVGIRLVLEYFPVPLYHFDRSYLAPLIDAVAHVGSEVGVDGPSVEQLFPEHPDGSLALEGRWSAVKVRRPRALLRLPLVVWRSATSDPLDVVAAPRAQIVARARELQRVPLPLVQDAALVHTIRESQALLAYAFASRKPFILGAWSLTLLLGPFLRLLFGRRAPSMLADLRAGLAHPTARMNDELRALGDLVEKERRLQAVLRAETPEQAWDALQRMPAAPIFVKAVEEFVDHYGCRTELPIPLPSARAWTDHPVHVLRLLRNLSEPAHTARRQSGDRHVFARAYREAIGRAKKLRVVRCDRLLRLLVRRNRSLWLERDWVILAYEQAVAPARAAMREIGMRLVRQGALRSWTDVRYLSIDEASRSLVGKCSPDETRRFVEHRRAGRSRTVQNWSDAVAATAASPKQGVGVVLRGTAASPGVAIGPASLVLSDRDIEGVRRGGILVCRSTGPSWTPLFGTVAAVVTDLGGPLSHAAIVAREYGIPAVIGTGNATSMLQSDRVYAVDGFTGEVRWSHTPPSET